MQDHQDATKSGRPYLNLDNLIRKCKASGMSRYYLELSEAERHALEAQRDHAKAPYLREKAAALLKIADGSSATLVARTGLHKPRRPETVLSWLAYYRVHRALPVRPATRRAFSPAGQSARTNLGANTAESKPVEHRTESLEFAAAE